MNQISAVVDDVVRCGGFEWRNASGGSEKLIYGESFQIDFPQQSCFN